jgi:hypothetical protein
MVADGAPGYARVVVHLGGLRRALTSLADNWIHRIKFDYCLEINERVIGSLGLVCGRLHYWGSRYALNSRTHNGS